jgi:hypothetical protein
VLDSAALPAGATVAVSISPVFLDAGLPPEAALVGVY